jgi:RNA polymerase sigma-70 factor (ECF subfamily)
MEELKTEENPNFTEIYNKYFESMLMSVCMKYTKDMDTAMEYCQNGFVKVYKVLDRYDDRGSMEGFLRRVITNSIIDQLRKEYRKRETLIDTEWNDFFVDVEGYETLLDGEENFYTDKYSLGQVETLLEKMTPSYRTVFELYYFEGLQHKEIAQHLGISEGTSKSNLSKCRKKLQKMLVSLN